MMRTLGCTSVFGFALVVFSVQNSDVRAQWSDVKGKITWKFKQLPKRQPLAAVKDNQDKKACLKNGPILDQIWIVNAKNKGIKNVFVWLAPMKKDGKLPIHPSLQKIKNKNVEIDQPCCMFVPHALGMREGQVLIARNSSKINHNFKWQGSPFANISGNVSIPAGMKAPIKNLPANRLPIIVSCQIHPWMQGYIRVFNHPYFAVTDENGAFEMPNAPAGQYRLFIWHGAVGWSGGEKGANGYPVEINSGKATDLGAREFLLN